MALQKQVQIQEATFTAPLTLAPLLAPHRKHGRLSIRVERMPQQARLSRGTRTHDGNWSLASDELDDLQFVAPVSLRKVHKLSVRLVSLVNGDTVATLEVVADPDHVPAPQAALQGAVSPQDLAELETLRRELAAAKDALSARDAELAERLASAAGAASAQFHETLAKAESTWAESETARLASVQEQWQERFAEALVDVEEEQARRFEGRIQELQHKLDEVQVALVERESELAQARAENKPAPAEASSETAAQVAALEAELAARKGELATALALNAAQKREAESALAKAERAWKDGEAERLAAAEAKWREASAQALADARADSHALKAQGDAGHAELLNHLTQAQAAIAERDAALARAQTMADAAREEVAERLAQAEASWRAAEAARTASAEAAWREKLNDAVAAARNDAAATRNEASEAPASVSGGELEALKAKLSAVQAKLDLREAAIARAAALANEERLRWQKDAQDAIRKAARERKGDEAARLAQAEAEWRRQAARELALATARAEAAEAALSQVRITTQSDTRVSLELQALRSALAVRDSELSRLRGHGGDAQETEQTAEAAAEGVPAQRQNTLVRDVIVAVCVGLAGVALWTQLSPKVVRTPEQPPTIVHVAAPAPQPAQLPSATLSKGVKLRAAPAANAAVSGKLQPEARVEIVQRKDDWALVRANVAAGQQLEGWLKSSVLRVGEEPVALRGN